MSHPSWDVQVDAGDHDDAPVELLEAAVRLVLATEGVSEGEISVALLTDERMTELNLRYLGHDRTTDVIAFDLSDGDGAVLGDVYLGFEQAVRQADEHGVERDEELARLAIHGTLHVLGHDHPKGDEHPYSPMFELQERLLRELLSQRPGG